MLWMDKWARTVFRGRGTASVYCRDCSAVAAREGKQAEAR